jgi:hypothetical protein
MTKRARLTAVLVLGLTCSPMTAMADHHGGWHGGGRYHGGWRGGGDLWAIPALILGSAILADSYNQPPPVIIENPVPTVVAQPPFNYALAPAPAGAVPTWYYCGSAGRYYPYVATCPEGWQSVPAYPPDAR